MAERGERSPVAGVSDPASDARGMTVREIQGLLTHTQTFGYVRDQYHVDVGHDSSAP